MDNKLIRVAITHGDTNGVGYELIFKTFEAQEMLELCTPVIYGSPKTAAFHRNALQMQVPFTNIGNAQDAKEGRLNMLVTFPQEVKVEFGKPTEESDAAALKALIKAKDDYQKKAFDVLVTAPTVEKHFTAPLPMLVNDRLRIAMATSGLPIKDVPKAITQELLEEKSSLLHLTLRRDFRISNPRIAILALNPQPGDEETQLIKPVIEKLQEDKIQIFGPYPANTFFGEGKFEAFDGVLALYDEQAMTPFKTLDLGEGVCYAAGQDIIQTAPLNDAGFSIAGKGIADESSMRHAIYLAIDICRNRVNYDEPLKNPLKKLYHEKRDESEKVRFNIPKAKEPTEQKDEKKAEQKD